MDFKEILAIAGQSGLYKYVAQSARGVIVESLVDGKRSNAASASKVSALAEISMFTEGDDIPLSEVFTKIYALSGGKKAISHKESGEKIEAYFAEALPEYDRSRVRLSDMKKCFNWFNILVEAGFTSFESSTEEQSTEEQAAE